MQYVKALPPLKRSSRFQWEELLPKLRRDEWLECSRKELQAILGGRCSETGISQSAKTMVKQKIVVATRRNGSNGDYLAYLRLY